MLLHAALQEKHALRGIEAGGEIVEQDLFDVVRDLGGVGVVGGEGVPVGDKEVAIVLILQLDPVGAPM
jgi:hypothetical protein